MPKPPKDDEVEAEDTQIFDSNKYPVLKRPVPAKPAGAPVRPTPSTRPPPMNDAPEPPQPTRVVVMQVPPEAIPAPRPRDKRDSQPGMSRDGAALRDRRDSAPPPAAGTGPAPRRSKPPSNISHPAAQGQDAGVPAATPNVVPRVAAGGNALRDTEPVPR